MLRECFKLSHLGGVLSFSSLYPNGIHRAFGRALVVLFAVVSPSACSTTNLSQSKDLIFLGESRLDEELGETSGLYCDASGAFTINDSGNRPVVYKLADDGRISLRYDMEQKNRDWEAITGDDRFFYVADIGNNSGKRKELFVHKVDKLNTSKATTLVLKYDGVNIKKNTPLAHDYDAEALVARKDELVLFSKSWLTQTLHVYKLDKSQPSQTVSSFTDIKGIPGVITGADWDSVNQRYVLVGYSTGGFGFITPFIATMSANFQLLSTSRLHGYGQVEAVCVKDNGEVWFTQENSPFDVAKLVRVRIRALSASL